MQKQIAADRLRQTVQLGKICLPRAACLAEVLRCELQPICKPAWTTRRGDAHAFPPREKNASMGCWGGMSCLVALDLSCEMIVTERAKPDLQGSKTGGAKRRLASKCQALGAPSKGTSAAVLSHSFARILFSKPASPRFPPSHHAHPRSRSSPIAAESCEHSDCIALDVVAGPGLPMRPWMRRRAAPVTTNTPIDRP